MSKSSSKTFLNVISILGCCLLNIPNGIPYYYGNLSAYTNSYFRYRIGPSAYNINSDWIMPAFVISFTLGIMTVDPFTNRFGMRLVQLINIVIFDMGLFLTYFTVQHSVGLMVVTLMMFSGYAFGSINVLCLKYAFQVVPQHTGLVSGIVNCAVCLGPVIYNHVVTAFVNPDNLTPDIRKTNMVFFSQADIIDSVPGAFLVIGTSTTAFHFLGFILLHLPFLVRNKREKSTSSEVDEQTYITMTDSESIMGQPRFTIKDSSQQNRTNTLDCTNTSCTPDESSDLKPSEVLKTKTFFKIWFYRVFMTYCIILTTNYYKMFGQLWIEDDGFLASIGSAAAVSNCVIRIAIGMSIDRFGVFNSMVAALSSNAILLVCWYFAPRLCDWLYLIFHTLLVGVEGTTYVLTPMAALNLYGSRHYATNYGLIQTAAIVPCLVCPFLYTYFLNNQGWLPLVFIGSFGSLLALVPLVLTAPPNRKG